ncbi:dihydrofolate synthase [Klebsiella variicola]|uniref:Dihydrofolate synthase n=1 Tax=Klebsiella variicola TaxID=244366 RepID=A0A7H4MPQ5_KLEVA|nr:dihydrofolate synthase [Klebsiella variicola]
MIRTLPVRWPIWPRKSTPGTARRWEGPRGATAEQLLEHLRGGTVYTSVAQAWHAAMADAKVEDTVLVCGSFHTVAQVMEEIDAGRIGGE